MTAPPSGNSDRQIFACKAWVAGAPATFRVFPKRYEWEPRDGRAHRTAPPTVLPARGRLSARAVTRVDRARSGLTTSRVTLILDSGADRPDLKVDASHDDIALLYRIALEMAGLPGTAPKRLLDGPGRALARRLDAISESGLGAPKTPASQRPSDGHDLLGCLARLLAANILTVEEFESKRRQLGS